MMLEHSCDISRNQPLGTNGRYQMAQLATAVPCLFLPVGSRIAVEQGFTIGRDYEVFFDSGADVKVGDKLARDGKSYIVSYVQTYETAYAGHVHIFAKQEPA